MLLKGRIICILSPVMRFTKMSPDGSNLGRSELLMVSNLLVVWIKKKVLFILYNSKVVSHQDPIEILQII